MGFFTKKEDAFLKANYKLIPANRMARMLGRSECGARQRMVLLGLKVPLEIIQKFKDDSRFKKGVAPANKGKKWSEFMTKEGMRNSRKTTFQKGHPSINRREVGSERLSKDGYIEVKIAEPNKWALGHRLIYELFYGQIPKGMNVEFKDRNRQNIDPDNLILRTRGENMKLNTYHNYPKEIATTIQLLGAIRRQINKKVKQLSNEK